MKILHTRIAYQGWLKLLVATVLTPDGRTVEREFIDAGPSAGVLAYDPERRVALMVRQFRAPVFYAGGPEELMEVVAGRLDGDTPEVCARREALEEAGVRLEALDPVGAYWSSPGPSTEQVTLFLGAYGAADRIGPGGGVADEHEHITVQEIPLSELWAMVQNSKIGDLMTLTLISALHRRRPELFDGQ